MPEQVSNPVTVFTKPLWLCLLLLLVIQAVLAFMVLHVSWLQQVDSRVSTALALAPGSPARAAFAWITTLGSGRVVLPAMLLVSVVLLLRDKRWQAASLWAGLPAARLVTDGLKYLVARPRPTLNELGYMPADWDTLSFPSGHTTSAVLLYGFLVLLCLDAPLSRMPRTLALSLLLLAMLAVGVSRIVLGRHFPSDVMGGVISGCIGLIAARLIMDRGKQGTPDV